MSKTLSADKYRLYALAGGSLYHPGVASDEGNDWAIEVEAWWLPTAQFGSFAEPVFIATITVAELLAGVKLAKTADEHIRRYSYVEKLLTHMPVIAFDTEVARIYAELYAYALSETKRSKINVHDLQIAATALSSGYVVLTSNVDDFTGIPGLRVLSPHGNSSVHEASAEYGR